MMRSMWLLLALFLASAAQLSAAVTARVEDYSPILIQTGMESTISIKVRCTGIQTDFRFAVATTPDGWTVETPTPSSLNIAGNKVGTFQCVVDPGLSEGNAQIKLTLYGNNEFGDEVKVLDKSLTIESLAPPGDFFIQLPYVDEEVSVPFPISWTSALRADTYAVLIYEPDNLGQPKEPPVFALTGMVQTNYNYTGSALVKGKEYLVWIFATNRIANKSNVGGPRRIKITPPPPLGSFDVTSPTPNQTLSKRPVISWSPSSNAASYTLNVLPERDGVPVSDPVRTVTGITTTSYTWVDPPLTGGVNYYVTVQAVGEAGTLFNSRGPVKFFASALEPFSLTSPNPNQQNVNRLTPLSWQRSDGATYYKLKVEVDNLNGTRGLVYDVQVPQVPLGMGVTFNQPSSNLLVWGKRYFWSVTAHTANEERRSDSNEWIFETTNVRPFDLVAPLSNATGVPVRPTFSWKGTNTGVSYFVQLTVPDANGRPVVNPVQNGPVITQTEWTSTFSPLTPGASYFWRAGAFAGSNLEYNYGDWQKFTVNPITATTFRLLAPADGAMNVSVEPVLSWEKVTGAEGYVLDIRIPNVLDLDPIVVRGVEGFDLAAAGLRLNGEQTYEWTVTAFAGSAVLPASGSWVFTTVPRAGVDACDIADYLGGVQALGARERTDAGLVGVIDAASYVRYVLLPENRPCER